MEVTTKSNLESGNQEDDCESPISPQHPMSPSYNKSGVFQGYLIKLLNKEKIPEILNSIDKAEILSEEPFVIVDYGSAGGKNSYPFFKTIIKYVHSINPAKEIEIFLNDIPENDFRIPFLLFDQKFLKQPKVFVYAVGKSFYKKVVSEKKVNIMFAFICLQWLNDIVCPYENEFIATSLQKDPSVRKLWENQGKNDLELFLKLRKTELKKNGILCFTIPISNEITDDAYQILIRFQQAKTNVLKQINLDPMNTQLVINEYFRNFKDCEEVIMNLKDLFQINELKDIDLPIWEFDEILGEKSVERGASSYAYSWKTALEYSFINILSSKGEEICQKKISMEEARKINDDIYENAIKLMLDYYREKKIIKFKICFGCLKAN